MTIYARIDSESSTVAEIIPPITYDVDSPPGSVYEFKAGDEVPIDRRYTPDFVAALVDITAVNPQPQPGWTATQDGSTWTFAAPQTPGNE